MKKIKFWIQGRRYYYREQNRLTVLHGLLIPGGIRGFAFALHHPQNHYSGGQYSRGWMVTELSTGIKMSDYTYPNQMAAIIATEKAIDNYERDGRRTVKQLIADAMEHNKRDGIEIPPYEFA
jgi:hypothetical protein